MISIIISSFLHSVVLANPVDQATDSVSHGVGKTESTSESDDEKEGSPADKGPNIFDGEPMKYQYYSDDDGREHSVNIHKPLHDDTHQSTHTLSSSNLTFDAFSYHDQSVPTSPQKPEEPRVNTDRKQDKRTDDIDMQYFIKQVINKQFANVPALTFFDAAIVYDERDYSEAMKFRNEIMNILRPRVGGDLRIELFDSEQFAQSKVMVVKDVLDRCSVVLLYLTPNFSTPELNLFVEESIAMTRLGYGQFQSGSYDSHRRWVLKPVHTEPQSRRRYSVPTGLLSLRGINWYDKSKYTLDQIIAIFDTAITERKQRETGANTDFACQHTFGGKVELPHQRQDVPSFLNVTLPPEDTRLPQMSQDGFSFPSSLQPTPTPDIRPLSVHQSYLYHQTEGQHYQHEHLRNTNMNQNHHFSGAQFYTHGETYAPRMSPNYAQIPAATTRVSYPGQTLPMLQPGFINDSTIAQTDARYGLPYSQYAHASGLQRPPAQVPMDTYPSIPGYDAQPSYVGQQQHEYQQRQTAGPSSYQYQDAEYMPGPNTKPSHRTNAPYVIPNNTPSQFTSNLSTDDVEIDNYADADEKSTHRKQEKRRSSKKSQRKKKPVQAHVVDTDSSSDSSDDEDVYTTVPRRSKNKIINITGCSVVQLGKGNLVTKPKTPVLPLVKPSTRNDTVKENIPSTHGIAMESVSEDNMSYTSEVERGVGQLHGTSNAVNTHWNISNDTDNMRKGDVDINFTNNMSENQLNTKSAVFSDDVQQTQSQTRTKLNVAVNNDSPNTSLDDIVNDSPDTNFNDDELFVSGPLGLKKGPQVDTQVRNAPFLFSQTRKHVHILPHLTPIHNTTDMTADSSEDSELD